MPVVVLILVSLVGIMLTSCGKPMVKDCWGDAPIIPLCELFMDDQREGRNSATDVANSNDFDARLTLLELMVSNMALDYNSLYNNYNNLLTQLESNTTNITNIENTINQISSGTISEVIDLCDNGDQVVLRMGSASSSNFLSLHAGSGSGQKHYFEELGDGNHTSVDGNHCNYTISGSLLTF